MTKDYEGPDRPKDSNVIPFREKAWFNHQLKQVHLQLKDFIQSVYGEALHARLEQYMARYVEVREGFDQAAFTALVTPWLILHEELDQGQTIFSNFLAAQGDRLDHPILYKVLNSWPRAVSSVFKILEEKKQSDTEIFLVDLDSGERFKIPKRPLAEQSSNPYMVATLIPIMAGYDILLDQYWLLDEVDYLWLEDKRFDETSTYLFPEWLALLFSASELLLEFEREIYEEVAEDFVWKMMDANIEEEWIELALLLWHEFSSKYEPEVLDRNRYLAALEYVISLEMGASKGQMEKKIYGDYGLTLLSIQGLCKLLQAEYDLMMEELF